MKEYKIEKAGEDIFEFIWRRKLIFIIVGIIAVIGSVIASYMITEKFQSTAIVFPAKSTNVSISSDNLDPDQSPTTFGEEEEAEQLLQIIKSAQVRDKVCQKFNLMEHYDIDADDKRKFTKLYRQYKSNTDFRRTQYGSVEISVLDEDPRIAAAIANEISQLIDTVKNSMVGERSANAFLVIKKKRQDLLKSIQELEQNMQKLTEQGVVNKEARAYLEEAFAKSGGTNLAKKIEINGKYGSVYDSYEFQLEWMSSRLSTTDALYEQYEADANAQYSHRFVVETAQPAETKAYPVRWLIVFGTLVASMVFTLVFLLFRERINKINDK